MSHYCEIELKLQGDAEAVVRALMECENGTGTKWTREDIEVHAERVNLFGYLGDMRAEKAHIVVRARKVQQGANDLGFEKKANGTWAIHVSEFDKGYYNADWQKRLLGKWAVQKTGMEAEKQGSRWNVQYAEENGVQYAYVRVMTGGVS